MINRLIESTSKCLRRNLVVKRFLYDPFKAFFRRRLCTFSYMLHYMKSNRQYAEEFPQQLNAANGIKEVGILRDPFYGHEPYMAACRELGVGYRVVDIFASNWIDLVNDSGCDAFLVWPGESIQEWKRLYDDRLRFMVEHMGKRLFPDVTATWIYGSKERQLSWLELNGFPHSASWVFYDELEALKFVRGRDVFPIVAKMDIGAVSSGVQILKSRRDAERYVKEAFRRGIVGYYADRQARQWRHVLLQEYLPNAKEWRVHRLGDSFFGFGKVKKGGFHSGSGETHWVVPPKGALDLAWAITERGGFKSMAVDIFETVDGRFLVNELQCVYGQHGSVQLVKDGKSGRLLHESDGTWRFEAGEFAVNHGCNLRVQEAIKLTGTK